jgi:hypothetical protein
MTTVDVITGTITPPNTTITHGTQFEWTCANVPAGTAITVTAQIMLNGNPWFVASPTSFTTPANSVPVTAQASGQWNWTATGVLVDRGAHIIIRLSEPARKAS